MRFSPAELARFWRTDGAPEGRCANCAKYPHEVGVIWRPGLAQPTAPWRNWRGNWRGNWRRHPPPENVLRWGCASGMKQTGRPRGISNRVSAWREHHGIDVADLPFAVVPVALDLLTPDGDTALIPLRISPTRQPALLRLRRSRARPEAGLLTPTCPVRARGWSLVAFGASAGCVSPSGARGGLCGYGGVGIGGMRRAHEWPWRASYRGPALRPPRAVV